MANRGDVPRDPALYGDNFAGIQPQHREAFGRAHLALIRLWDKAKEHPDYVKAEWKELDNAFEAFALDTAGINLPAHACTHLTRGCCRDRSVCVHAIACTHGFCCNRCWRERCPENLGAMREHLGVFGSALFDGAQAIQRAHDVAPPEATDIREWCTDTIGTLLAAAEKARGQ